MRENVPYDTLVPTRDVLLLFPAIAYVTSEKPCVRVCTYVRGGSSLMKEFFFFPHSKVKAPKFD